MQMNLSSRFACAPRLVTLAILAMACADNRQDVITGPGSVSEARTALAAPLYGMANPRRVRGRYIVRFKPGTPNVAGLSNALAAGANGRVYRAFEGLKGFWGELPDA